MKVKWLFWEWLACSKAQGTAYRAPHAMQLSLGAALMQHSTGVPQQTGAAPFWWQSNLTSLAAGSLRLYGRQPVLLPCSSSQFISALWNAHINTTNAFCSSFYISPTSPSRAGFLLSLTTNSPQQSFSLLLSNNTDNACPEPKANKNHPLPGMSLQMLSYYLYQDN